MSFRKWSSIALVSLAVAGCHPRYVTPGSDVEGPGTGGSGGLDSVRMRILALIAMRDYEHARECLELAANLSEEERERFDQMISAAERGLVPFLEDKLPHIFRPDEGHFPEDTAQARELIQTTAIKANLVGTSRWGYQVYQRILESGEQVWVWVSKGRIFEAGLNKAPVAAERLLK
ncbi:MAG TPA: hypothetical protein VFT91_09470 [Dehalococcoidia bacterium]|nr:hypothetical protein [Dehalococcoidia bacterium]